ncbi:MAG: hypothetical protein A2Z09_00015 [Nitrospirae bacterium RBG_16_43_8]|nr:MAG: hypothetical protein A2Z09_00015 [Nitrospirae bacterium RBG_16_43_8]
MSEKSLKYFIDESLFTTLETEFGVEETAKKYAGAISGKSEKEAEEIGEKFFKDYGINFARRIMELEGNYRDRSAEMIYEVAKKTGHDFPSIAQRLLEIAILSVRVSDKWRWQEISFKRLAYSVTSCGMNKELIAAVGQKIANKLPCRHYCLSLSEELYKILKQDVGVRMTAELPKDGRCQFDGFYHFS